MWRRGFTGEQIVAASKEARGGGFDQGALSAAGDRYGDDRHPEWRRFRLALTIDGANLASSFSSSLPDTVD